MANQTAKPAGPNSAKPQIKAASMAAAAAPESRPATAAQMNALLGSSLAPASAESRQAMIAEAAYFIAEQRGFGSGRELEDWLLAEKQIDAVLAS